MLLGACSQAWTLPSTAQQSAFNLPAASDILVQPNPQNQPVPQIDNGYGAPQKMPNGRWNQEGNGNQPAPQPGNNYGNISEGVWMQQKYQIQSGSYERGSGMRGGWTGYDNCMVGYGNNNGYDPGQMSGSGSIPPISSTPVSFSRDVQPIFNASCISCHGGKEGLYLDSYTGVVNGSMSWPVVIPGDPINSRLIQLVSSEYMPYGGPSLNQDQTQKLVNWIAAGAPNN